MKRRKPDEKPLEAEITASIRFFLGYLDIFHWKVFQTLGSEKGVSDIIGCKPTTINELLEQGVKPDDKIGLFFACEVKTEKGKKEFLKQKTRRAISQGDFLKRAKQCGGIGFIATCVEDVMRGLHIKPKPGWLKRRW